MTAEDRMERAIRWIMIGAVLFVSAMFIVVAAFAHDHNHPELDAWYGSLMQPDNPAVSCCGLADAYWCDDYYARDGKAFCKITDDRDLSYRPNVPVGTEIEIPERKLKWDRGNPTGHSVVFLSSGGSVLCFVQAGGV